MFQFTKIGLLDSFLLHQEFLGCQEWLVEMLAFWMVKIPFKSYQILHTNVSTSFAAETKMEVFALVYLAFS